LERNYQWQLSVIDGAATAAVRRKSFSETYIGEWITTTDKSLVLCMFHRLFFFLVGGMEALLVRAVGRAEWRVLKSDNV